MVSFFWGELLVLESRILANSCGRIIHFTLLHCGNLLWDAILGLVDCLMQREYITINTRAEDTIVI